MHQAPVKLTGAGGLGEDEAMTNTGTPQTYTVTVPAGVSVIDALTASLSYWRTTLTHPYRVQGALYPAGTPVVIAEAVSGGQRGIEFAVIAPRNVVIPGVAAQHLANPIRYRSDKTSAGRLVVTR
jgi:hypothetical protein